MPIKLVNSDAKGFFRKFVSGLAEIEAMIPSGISVPQAIQAKLQEIQGVKSVIESSILANEAMWKESGEFPIFNKISRY